MSVKYSEEFKRDAVALVDRGSTQKQVCRDLGVSKATLWKWVQDEHLRCQGMVPEVASPDERRQMVAALRRIEELEMENEILRQASAYLSQANLRRRPK
jgi:transposase